MKNLLFSITDTEESEIPKNRDLRAIKSHSRILKQTNGWSVMLITLSRRAAISQSVAEV
jgi:hypothetical protein